MREEAGPEEVKRWDDEGDTDSEVESNEEDDDESGTIPGGKREGRVPALARDLDEPGASWG